MKAGVPISAPPLPMLAQPVPAWLVGIRLLVAVPLPMGAYLLPSASRSPRTRATTFA